MNPSVFQFHLTDPKREAEAASASAQTLHIHIHLDGGVMPGRSVPAEAAITPPASRKPSLSWPAACACAVILASAGFLGGRWGQANADPAISSLQLPVGSPVQMLQPQESERAVTSMPPAIQRDLALPPTVTPPQGTGTVSAKPPFGLQD